MSGLETYLIVLYANIIMATAGPIPNGVDECKAALNYLTLAKDMNVVEYAKKLTPLCILREKRPVIGSKYIKRDGD